MARAPTLDRRPRKAPEGITYGLDAVPPVTVVALSALQHVAIIGGASFIFPLLVLRHLGATPAESARVISACMLALGLATMIQARRGRWVGSGFLAPAVFTAAYLPANLAAADLGGLPLVAGMTIVAGLTEIAIGAALFRLRPFMPAEIAGFAVMMIGIVLGMLGFGLMIGPAGGAWAPESMAVTAAPALQAATGVVALAVMMALSTWGTPRIRVYGVLIGIVAGYAAALTLGTVDGRSVMSGIMTAPALPALPSAWPTFALDLLVPYLIGALVCALRTLGDIATCQKINDAAWTRPDMRSIQTGVVGDGVGTGLAGALGAVGLNTFSGCIALSAATGVTSRVVGYATGGLCIVIGFLPGVASAVSLMPPPVMGATLVFSGSFVIFNGIQIIVARLLDSRKILVIGTSLTLGISGFADPQLYARLPDYLQPIASHPFTLAMISALVLNAVFRIGIRRRASLGFDAWDGGAADAIIGFLTRQGAAWGARREVIDRVASALVEFSEHLREHAPHGEQTVLTLAFDETSVHADIAYGGPPIVLPSASPPASPEAAPDLDSFDDVGARIIAGLADRARTSTRDSRHVLHLTFVH